MKNRPGSGPRPHATVERRQPTGDWQWALALLPAFPLLLLVLRVWYLARQDLSTVLLVLQSTSALGLFASLLISMIWAIPALLLVLRTLYLMQLASEATGSSWLTRVGARTPVWVGVPAAIVAALSWQLRFLPALLMLLLVIAGLEMFHRVNGPGRARRILPAWAAISALTLLPAALWLWPDAYRAVTEHGDVLTAVLLVVPLLAAPVLPGPLPQRAARWLLPAVATVVAIAVPIVLGQRYLDAPVLPRVAVRIQESTVSGSTASGSTVSGSTVSGSTASGAAPQIRRGSLVSVNDRFVTLLDASGRVHFIPLDQVVDQVLCSTGREPPTTPSNVHGWQVEQSVLSWTAPDPAERASDIACRGT